MHSKERLHTALQKIVQARASIVKTAAAWQAQGVETSPLADPLVQIQEAVAQLEALAASLPGSVGAGKPETSVKPVSGPVDMPKNSL